MFGIENLSLSNFIEHYGLGLNAIAFFAYTFAVARVTSFNSVMLGVILISFIHIRFSMYVIPLFSDESFLFIIGYLWYLFFAITDIIFIYLSIKLIKKYRLRLDRASMLVLLAFALSATIQVFRLVMRELGSDFGYHFYSNSIVILSISVSLLATLMAVRAVLVRFGFIKFEAGRE